MFIWDRAAGVTFLKSAIDKLVLDDGPDKV